VITTPSLHSPSPLLPIESKTSVPHPPPPLALGDSIASIPVSSVARRSSLSFLFVQLIGLFSPAQKEIVRLMRTDTFARFCRRESQWIQSLNIRWAS
jgi:hypothetical protein